MRIIIDIDGHEVRPHVPKPKTVKKDTNPEEDDLRLRMMNQEALQEDEQAKLEGEIVLYVRKLMGKKKKGQVVSFLKSIKDSISDDLRSLLGEEIKI